MKFTDILGRLRTKNKIKEQKEIKNLIKDAYEIGIDPWKLFYEHYPVDGCDSPEHYGIKIYWEK